MLLLKMPFFNFSKSLDFYYIRNDLVKMNAKDSPYVINRYPYCYKISMDISIYNRCQKSHIHILYL